MIFGGLQWGKTVLQNEYSVSPLICPACRSNAITPFRQPEAATCRRQDNSYQGPAGGRNWSFTDAEHLCPACKNSTLKFSESDELWVYLKGKSYAAPALINNTGYSLDGQPSTFCLMGALMGAIKKRPERRFFTVFLAEQAGFEPAVGDYPTHAFQACDLNHSSTAPRGAHCSRGRPFVKVTFASRPMRSRE